MVVLGLDAVDGLHVEGVRPTGAACNWRRTALTGGAEARRPPAEGYHGAISELAELSGVSPGMLRDIRRGDRRPSEKTLEAIAGALERMLEQSEDS